MKKARHENPGNGGFRLNRYLASCGLGSRRNVEILVTRGRVTINGVTITTPAARVSEGDLVEVDGMSVEPREKNIQLF
ncbi:MAG: rRNA synthase, partial [Synergistales bacterium]|nr:rRNA synthase [Synergistales bacterium]